jgi:hypothetical protein
MRRITSVGVIAVMDQRVVHVQDLHARVTLLKPRDVRVVQPQSIGGRADIRRELARLRRMQTANRRRQHDDVTGTLKRTQYQPTHG